MTEIYSVLHIAKGGVLSHQKSLQVTAHNIANVNTEGYSRQRVRLVTNQPVDYLPGQLGLGVKVAEIKRVVSSFITNQINSEMQGLGRWDSQKASLEKVEMIFSGEYFNNLSTRFWNAWEDLANNPSGQAERVALLGSADELVSFLKKTYRDLVNLQKNDIGQGLKNTVEQVNALSKDIADLNVKILAAEASGQNANDLRDKRELYVKEISELIPVNVFEDGDGNVVILTAAGRPIVEAASSWDLVISIDERGLETVNWQDRNGNLFDLTNYIRQGRLGGYLIARDDFIEKYISDLNTFSKRLMEEVNTLHASGYGISIDPNTGLPYTGLKFFTGTDISTISVNLELFEDPGKIAAAKSNAYGDNTNALAIANLRYKKTMLNGTITFDGFYQGLVSRIGSDVKQAQSFSAHQNDVLTYLNNFRESESGVSIDEEMMNMLEQQRAYQASAKVINVVDELLEQLLSI